MLLEQVLPIDIVDHIITNTSPVVHSDMAGVVWWLPQVNGQFTTKSAFDIIRRRKENIWWVENIWIKGFLLKSIFSMEGME